MNQLGGIIFVALAILVLLIAIVWGVVSSRKAAKADRARFEPLRAVMDGGEAKAGAWGLDGRFHGRKVSVRMRGGGRGHPPRLLAQMACSAAWRFKIVDAHRVGVMPPPDSLAPHRLQVGEADLDQRFNFVSPDAERFEKWSLVPENKEKFTGLLSTEVSTLNADSSPEAAGSLPGDLDSGFWPERRYLELSRGQLELGALHYSNVDLAPEAFRGILETLDQLARSIESS